MSINVDAVEEAHTSDRLIDEVDPENSRISRLGIVGVSINEKIAPMIPDLRTASGVLVVARVEGPAASGTALQVADVIHEVNGAAVDTIDDLRVLMEKLRPGEPVALFVERESKLLYVAFDVE
jgi:S1-C subfamily serine protease